MKGFIEVTRFSGRDMPGMPLLVATKAILLVRGQSHGQRAHITTSVKEQRYEDGPLENESFEVSETFEEVQKRLRIATGQQLPH